MDTVPERLRLSVILRSIQTASIIHHRILLK